ncbi:MAG: electron transport complex subunit RsxC [Clostridia bacterium]|nr:electron transport complex subunit RsxC [Clostridia bacterium]
MTKTEKILRPVKHIFGGAGLEHHKNTASFESVIMPPPDTVYIPLSQHIGAPCEALVKKDDYVYVGTKIGESAGFVSAPIHSSVSGTVVSVGEKMLGGNCVNCVEIKSDGEMKKDPSLEPFSVNCKEDIALAAKLCGLVGLGGAGFPTHVKLTPPKESKIDTLIINGAECEPYITSDNRECIENFNDVIEGIYLLKSKLEIKRVVICIEKNKPRAIDRLYRMACDHRDFDDSVKLMCLPSRYPQGAEKVIIYSATGRKLPLGKLPSDVGCIVMNITSIGTLYRFITTGMPLVSKRITFDGTAVSEPKNIIVPIGTPIEKVIEFAGGVSEDADKIIIGGPMMGNCVASADSVIEKRNNAILVMKREKEQDATQCIRCGRCVMACPMQLYPAMVESAYNKGLTENYEKLNVNYCMECGSCSYVCPAKRPLTQVMRVAKAELRRQKK